MKEYIINLLKKDIVFAASAILAIMSSFVYQPKLEYIDFKVIVSLFNLMIVVKAFEGNMLLDKLAIALINKCKNSRIVSFVLIFLCYFSAMLITNDVALLTFVPLTIILSKKAEIPMMTTVIFETLAANIGSSLTPMGNPQNLFIFSRYNLTLILFLKTIAIVVLIGGIWLYVLNIRLHKHILDIRLPSINIKNKNAVIAWIMLFFTIIASILGMINYIFVLLITLVLVFVLDKSLIFKIDYLLLLTFISFFVFIGNISNIDYLNAYMIEHLNSPSEVFLNSLLMSQVISNVPAAIFIAKFTNHWKALLLGVSIGGMGTIIASLASVISYKIYIKSYPGKSKKYMIKFSIYNFMSLIIFGIIGYFLSL